MFRHLLFHRKNADMLPQEQRYWNILRQDLQEHGVQMLNMDTLSCAENLQTWRLPEEIPAKEILMLTDRQQDIAFCREAGIAAAAYETAGGGTLYGTEYVLLGLEEVDYEFLNRIYQRKHGIPWHILDTERCSLREFALEDMDALFALYAKDGVTDYIEPLFPYEEEYRYQKDYIENMYRYYGYGMWLVIDRDTQQIIGRAGLENRKMTSKIEETELELGYVIAPEYRRQGYAGEVCSAVIAWAAEELACKTILCFIEKDNEASVALVRHLGFTHRERTIRDSRSYELFSLEV